MSILDILGINESEEKIYRILLVSGQLTLGEIRIATSLDKEITQNSMKSLSEKKLVREIPGLQGRYACLLPLGNLKVELEKSVDEVTSLGAGLNETSTRVIEEMSTELNENSQKFLQDLDNEGSKIVEEVSNITSSALSEQEKLKEDSTNMIGEIEKTEKSRIEETHAKMIESISKQASKTSEALNTKLSIIDAKVDQIKLDQEKIKNDAESEIPNVDFTPVENTETQMIDSTVSFATQVKTTLTNTPEKLNIGADKLENTIKVESEKIQNIANEFQEGTNTTIEGITSTISELFTKENDEINGLVQEINATKNESVENINTIKGEQQNNFDNLVLGITEIQDQFKQYNSENSEEFNSTSTQMGSKIQELLGQSNDEITNQIELTKNQLNTSLAEETEKLHSLLLEHLNQVISQSKEQLQEFNEGFSEKIAATVSEINTNRIEGKENLEANIVSSVNNLQESFKSSVVKREESETNLFSSINEKISNNKQITDSMFDTIINNLENLSSTINSHTQAVLDQASQLNNSSSEKMNTIKSSQESNFNTIVVEALNEVTTILNQEITLLKEYNINNANELIQNFEQVNNAIQETIKENITIMKQTSIQIYDQTVINLKTAVDASHQKYIKLSEDTRATSVGSVKQVERDMDTLLEDLKSTLGEAMNEFNVQINSLTETIQSETTQFIDKSYSQIQIKANLIQDAGSQSIDQIKQVASGNSENQVSTVRNSFGNYQAKYNETSKVVSEKTHALANLLDALFNLQEGTETPPIKTSAVVGKDAIVSHISDIIGRTKSKVTILLPSIDMIDTEQIVKMKSTAQVTIISHIDEVVETDWIKKMHNATANVTLRSIIKSDFGGVLPDFIGVEREGEEILLGTIDEGAKDYVAIASASEYFVQILGNIVISGYSMGKSKQIKK